MSSEITKIITLYTYFTLWVILKLLYYGHYYIIELLYD